MNEYDAATPFRGLPLSPEQDGEIRHYIHLRQRAGLPWDTAELQAMIRDMLDPPETIDEDGQSIAASMRAERAAAVLDGAVAQDVGGTA